MMRSIFAATASLALVASGLVHGFWTDRWQPAAAPADAAARLDSLPDELGDWKGTRLQVKPSQAGVGVAGYIQRRYVHRRTGVTVVLALVCGRPGPVSIHTPEACYVASGYAVGPRSRVRPAGETTPDEFWTADATRTNASDETRLRLYWGWYAGGGWAAADAPRLTFARQPVLHKLYVLRELGGPGEPDRGEPCQDFLQVLLPELQRTLFAPGS
jgi:hypothetical protein